MSADSLIIESVKNGNREQYGELVDNYKRMVYAIAWSRLGDRDLCEDVVQETFLKGFQFLAGLRNPEKFAPWIARIARNVATTFGRQRHREVNDPDRWNLEAVAAPTQTADNVSSDEPLKEVLGDVLVKIPAAYREAIALFYLEDRSVRECATILGVSETSFKTRLFRARECLRGRMEERLERSLGTLTPRSDLRERVLAALPAMPMGWGGFASGAAFFMPALKMALLTLIAKIPFFGLLSWSNVSLSRNFRDSEDIRKRIVWRNFLVLVPTLVVIVIFAPFAVRRVGVELWCWSLALFLVPSLISALLLLRLDRAPFVVASAIGQACMFLSFVAIGCFGFKVYFLFLVAMLIYNVLLFRARRTTPMRQDYNLFLRAAMGGLPESETDQGTDESSCLNDPLPFVKFLGNAFLAVDYRQVGGLTTIYMPYVSNSLSTFVLPLRRFLDSSAIKIDREGRCQAFLSRTDARQIRRALAGDGDFSTSALENTVSQALQESLAKFQAGNLDGALKALQLRTEREIVAKPWHELKSTKVIYVVAIVGAIVSVVCFALINLLGH